MGALTAVGAKGIPSRIDDYDNTHLYYRRGMRLWCGVGPGHRHAEVLRIHA